MVLLVANVVPGFFSGVAFASLLLCVGLAIGIYLGRRMPGAVKSHLDPHLMIELMAGMMRLTSGVASDVSQHRAVIDRFAKGMKTDRKEPGEAVGSSELLAHVIQANEQLEQKLKAAESTLAVQAEEITAIMNEARTDPLTGLANRRAFDDEFARRLSQWKRHGTAMMLVLVDVDHFKRVNDQHGHPAGDAVLRQLGKILAHSVRDTDLVARYGGEEFAILLVESGIEGATAAVARIQQAMSASSFRHDDFTLAITASFGVTQPTTSDDPHDLLRRSDQALYAAKEAGRNCGFFHTGDRTLRMTTRKDEPKSATTSNSVEATENRSISSKIANDRAATNAPPNGFGNVCADLRRKLSEVIK